MPPDWVEGAVPQTIGSPVPVLLELLVVVVVHLAGLGDALSMVLHLSMSQMSGFGFWSEVAVHLISSSGLSSPTGGGIDTRRSCRASRSRTSRASPSPPLLSVAGRTSGDSTSLLCRVTGA